MCIYVGPLRHFELVLRQISLCSCSLHHLCSLLHVRRLTKCPSDIFVLIWTQVSSNTWILSWLIMLIMFWPVLCDVYTLGPICDSMPCFAHTKHTSCISCCIPMHLMLHPHASHAARTCINTYTAQTNTCKFTLDMHCVYGVFPFSMLFEFVYSILSWLCSVLGCFTFFLN